MENLEINPWANYLTPQDYLYVSIMKQEAFKHLIFQGAMTIVHIFLVIPSNMFTFVVIVKNKTLNEVGADLDIPLISCDVNEMQTMESADATLVVCHASTSLTCCICL